MSIRIGQQQRPARQLAGHHEDENGDKGLSVASFIADGVFVSNDIRPAGGVGTGSWEDKGDDKFG